MDGHCLTNEQILAFSTALFQAERSQATVEKYLRSVRAFSLFLDGQPVTKDTVMAWKKHFQRDRRKFCVIDVPRQYENLRLSQE